MAAMAMAAARAMAAAVTARAEAMVLKTHVRRTRLACAREEIKKPSMCHVSDRRVTRLVHVR